MLNSALLRRPRALTLTVTAIALWLVLTFAFQIGSPNSQAQTTTATAGLFARHGSLGGGVLDRHHVGGGRGGGALSHVSEPRR